MAFRQKRIDPTGMEGVGDELWYRRAGDSSGGDELRISNWLRSGARLLVQIQGGG